MSKDATEIDVEKETVHFNDQAHTDRWVTMMEQLASIGAWSYCFDSQSSWWSDEVFEIYGLPQGEPAPNPLNFFDEEGKDLITKAIENAFTSGKSWCYDLPFTDANGKRKWVRSSGRGLKEDGKTYIYGVFQDITQLYSLIQDNTERKGFFRSVIHNIPNPIMIKEANDLRYLMINRAAEELLGLSLEEVVGKKESELFNSEASTKTEDDEKLIVSHGRPRLIPEDFRKTAKGDRILRTRKTPTHDDKGNPQYLLCISEDVTDQLRMDKVISEQREVLVQSAKMSSLGMMAGGIAHEINNPLAIVYGCSKQISRMASTGEIDQEHLADMSSRIEATVERINEIVKGLKDFSRDDKNEGYEFIEAKSIVSSTLGFCSERLKRQQIELAVTFPESCILECQPIKISQVIVNFLNNAHDVLANKVGRRVIQLSVAESSNMVKFQVDDNGPGVPKDLMTKVLEPFFTTKGRGQGTGLGLSLSKGIADNHKGSIVCEDSLLGGASFSLIIPKRQTNTRAA